VSILQGTANNYRASGCVKPYIDDDEYYGGDTDDENDEIPAGKPCGGMDTGLSSYGFLPRTGAGTTSGTPGFTRADP
jgi:hypothetical protein